MPFGHGCAFIAKDSGWAKQRSKFADCCDPHGADHSELYSSRWYLGSVVVYALGEGDVLAGW